MQKNDLVTVAIEDIGVGGEGIGKVDGYTLFIKDAIIGDVVEAKIVKAKKNYGYARLMNIVTPSENRVEKPACQMARRCGGCQIQEMKYGAQLAFKEGKVRGNLERIGEVLRIQVSAEFARRNACVGNVEIRNQLFLNAFIRSHIGNFIAGRLQRR